MPEVGSRKVSCNDAPQANERLFFLDALKAVGIVMVVCVHVLSKINLTPALHEGLLFLVGSIAVPLFLVADGLLFARQWSGKVNFKYRDYVRKSARRLVLPWAAFSSLYIIMRFLIEITGLVPDKIIIDNNLGGLVKVLYLSQLSHHMYFLLSLFLVRLLTVIVKPMLAYSGLVWFGAFAIYIGLYVSNNPKQYFLTGADPVLLAFWGAQFYFLGVLLQKWHEKINSAAVWLGPAGLGIAAAGWALLPASSLFLVQLSYLVGAYAALLSLTDATGWRFTMGKDTMGIYLLHAPYVLWTVVTVLSSVVVANHVGSVVFATITTVLISWGITRFIGKYSFGRLILGNPQSHSSPVALDRCCEVRT